MTREEPGLRCPWGCSEFAGAIIREDWPTVGVAQCGLCGEIFTMTDG